jgi:hypothetical protein
MVLHSILLRRQRQRKHGPDRMRLAGGLGGVPLGLFRLCGLRDSNRPAGPLFVEESACTQGAGAQVISRGSEPLTEV